MTGSETPPGDGGDRQPDQPEDGTSARIPVPPSFHTDLYMWLRMIQAKASNGIDANDATDMRQKLIEIRDAVVRLTKQLESGNE